jgi:hypothetical protein
MSEPGVTLAAESPAIEANSALEDETPWTLDADVSARVPHQSKCNADQDPERRYSNAINEFR